MKNALILLLALCIVSCGDKMTRVEFDNPSAKEVMVELDDGQAFAVEAGKSMEIVVKQGPLGVKIDGKDESITAKKTYNLVSLTKGSYILEELQYGAGPNSIVMSHKLPLDTVNVMGIPIPGHYKKVEGKLVILDKWDVGLDETPPQSIEVDSYSSGSALVKINRESDFIKRLLEMIQQMPQEEEPAGAAQ